MQFPLFVALSIAISAIACPLSKYDTVTKTATITVGVIATAKPVPVASSNGPNPTIIPSCKLKSKTVVGLEAPTSVYRRPPSPSSLIPTLIHKSGIYQENLSSGPEYKSAIVFHHNLIRTNHDANPITWDNSLEERAKWSAKQCNFTHVFPDKNTAGDGQNIFAASGSVFNITAGIEHNWYRNEFKIMTDHHLWGKDNIEGELFYKVGHLTQIVWKETTKVGCYSQDCSGSMKLDNAPFSLDKFTVCNYSKQGNLAGKFALNVGIPNSYNLPNWFD